MAAVAVRHWSELEGEKTREHRCDAHHTPVPPHARPAAMPQDHHCTASPLNAPLQLLPDYPAIEYSFLSQGIEEDLDIFPGIFSFTN